MAIFTGHERTDSQVYCRTKLSKSTLRSVGRSTIWAAPCEQMSSRHMYTANINISQWKRYSEPSLQRQHLFQKMLPLKWICCCKESLMDIMICKKDLVLFVFPHRTLCFGYLLESPHWCDSNKYSKHVAWSFNAMFLPNFSLIVISWAKISWHLNCHYNEFYRCIQCRYKEDWL